MSTTLITDATVEPITLAEARLHLRLASDYTAEDTTIEALIKAARTMAEHELGRALIQQTWEEVLDAFPDDEIMLSKPAVLAVISIKYIDAGGVERTIPSANYSLDRSTLPGWVKPAYGLAWPTDALDSTNVVRVRYTAGYGVDATAVPATVKRWMLIQIGTMWRNREAFVEGVSVADIPNRWVAGLLDSERVYA